MLDLQRASAGSGKTFALAKYYIRYLISIKPEGEDRRRLRTLPELEDGLGRILAVTFTNKATAEMQMRIVEKLDALARYRQGDKKPDYLDDFVKEFDVSQSQISTVCAKALRVLLNDYSNFKVSTIDAFFQLVLRTFAYESGYSDNYQVELESEYVSRVGIDAALDDVDSDRTDRNTRAVRYWVKLLMSGEEGTRWNIFQKQEPSRSFSTSPYKDLINSFKQIDNEEFREHRSEIEKYLADENIDLKKMYDDLDAKYVTAVQSAYDDMIACADKVLEITDASSGKNTKFAGYLYSRTLNVKDYKWDSIPKNFVLPFSAELMSKPSSKPVYDSEPEVWDERMRRFDLMYEKGQRWLAMLQNPEAKLWNAIRDSFPFLGILQAVQRKREDYLQENNSVELGETSLILSKIIGPSDTPFVYERMGTYLNHFLIDEFQDTSILQWRNLRPLLDESLSHEHDNLVIGDAKQSIYRFRNAEPKLISEIVPLTFYGRVRPLGSTPQENKNWRSDHDIVLWNNAFFQYVVKSLPDIVSPDRNEGVKEMFCNLYGNVKQDIRYPDGGYVRVYLKKDTRSKSKKGESFENAQAEEPSFKMEEEILHLILDALQRGYSQKDICILSRGKEVGTKVIDFLNHYNSEVIKGNALGSESKYQGMPLLNFVSEQSLLVNNSESVRRVVTILESISRSNKAELTPQGDQRRRYGAGNIKDLECHLMLFQQLHPELTRAECMERFLDEEPDANVVRDMLSEMQTMALPALVEATILKFVPDDVRRRDAVFLAAFQDAVLEYCDGHPSDLPSFLQWWERKRSSLCISSPEDADAISVMTVHKSKGLEFPIVIIPEVEKVSRSLGNFVSGLDWTWVERKYFDQSGLDSKGLLPPWMPVNISDKLQGTVLEPLLYNNYNLETMDSLNMAYVAMTRAVNEMYIFDKRRNSNFADKPYRGFGALLECFAEEWSEDGRHVRIDDGADNVVLEFGDRPEKKQDRNPGSGKDSDGVIQMPISDYHSMPAPPTLRTREASLPEYINADDYDADADRNPRSMGNICHGIMENVFVVSDLDREIERARLLGKMSLHTNYGQLLKEHFLKALESGRYVEQVRRWFGGGDCRIICERSLLKKGEILRRPDRLMIWPDRTVDIIDYKFGKVDTTKRHARQVKRYVDYMKDTGQYRGVRGWLWYIFEDHVEFVTD